MPPTIDDWLELAEELGPPTRETAGIVGTLRGPSERPYAAVGEPRVRVYGDWRDEGAAVQTVSEAEESFAQCLQHEPHPLDRHGYVLRIDPRGRVTELFSWHNRIRDSRRMHRCVRRTMRRLRFPESDEGERRAVVVPRFDVPARTPRDRYGIVDHATGLRVRVRTTSAVPGLTSRDVLHTPRFRAAVAACYDEAYSEDGPTTAHRLSLDVGPRGHIEAAELKRLGNWAAEGPSADFERCLEEALKKAPWRCPEQDTSARLGTVLCVHRDERPSDGSTGH